MPIASTPANRQAAAGIATIVLTPGITLGTDTQEIRKQIGWGYSGLPIASGSPAEPEIELFSFVTMSKKRLRCRKRSFRA